MKNKKRIVLFLSCIVLTFILTAARATATASSDGLWVAVGNADIAKLKTLKILVQKPLLPSNYRVVRLHRARMGKVLRGAPKDVYALTMAQPGARVITLPLPDGSFTKIQIQEAPILSPPLRQKYPNIRTYRGQGLGNSISVRFDVTPAGFHAQILSEKGTIYIDPLHAAANIYMVYWKRDLPAGRPFQCGVKDDIAALETHMQPLFQTMRSPNNPSGTQLRTYRLAITATGEYTEYFEGLNCPPGSPATCPVDAATAQITTTINRVTGIYEREVAISFNLVAMNIYEDSTTDPFPTGATVNGALLNQNQADLDSVVGSANYDIGHIFSQGGAGGLASRPAACNNAIKARGGTSLFNPSGEVFDVDFVSHEIGHQLGGRHSFNGNTGSCAGGNRNAGAAYEPGSGSTIMAYAGICGAQNVQANSDDYFHTVSFDDITGYRDGGGACGTVTATGNTVPIIDAGADYTIPRDTPFTLTASGSDADSDVLTYGWEQFDLGPAGVPSSTDTSGPLFRSRDPSSSPSRTLPRMQDILTNAPKPWEVLPTVDRSLNFRVTARDNRAGGGGADWDAMVVTVTGDPFRITAPAAGDALECGGGATLAWQVGGGSVAANVRALLSTDNGSSFSTFLPSTANDGAEGFTVPDLRGNQTRFKLEAIGNIFFDVSDQFSIVDTLQPVVTPPADLTGVECTSPAGASPAIGTASANDQCDTSPTIFNNAPISGIFPLGTTNVTWTAVDDAGNSGTATQTVTVVDTTPPDITAPADVVAECSAPTGTAVTLGEAAVGDICDTAVTVINDAPALFPLGTTTATWSATDDSGNVATDTQDVVIADTTPPSLSVSVSPSLLWPPNHKLVTITASIEVADICDANPVVRLLSITSDEADNGLGDGDTDNDIQDADFGTDDREFSLRAERSGTGDGRTYTITYEAQDASGNTTQQSVTVTVPKSL